MAVFGVGAIAPGLSAGVLEVELATPQMPALLFCFARLARSGPLFGVPALGSPAVALAVDHREPKASPPLGLGALDSGLPSVAAVLEEPKLGVDENAGLENAEDGDVTEDELMAVLTEV